MVSPPYRGRSRGLRIKKGAAETCTGNGVKETSRAQAMGCLADDLRVLAREIIAKVEASAYWDSGTTWTWIARKSQLHQAARQVKHALHKQMQHYSWPEKSDRESEPACQHADQII